MWKALLYAESEISAEKELKQWIEKQNFYTENAHQEAAVVCVAVAEPVTEQAICEAVKTAGAAPEECLMITAADREWEMTQKMNLAALPYINPALEGQEFHGAWLVVEGFEEINYDFFLKVYQRHHKLPWTVIETGRCILRELALTDMDALFELYAKAGESDFVEPLYPREEELEYQSAYIENMYRYYGYGMWLVCDKITGDVIGRAGLEHRRYPEGIELEMGYLISPGWRKKGYVMEVCRAIIDYAYRELDFPRINCLIREDNAVSIHLAEKLGFIFQGETDITGRQMHRYVLELGEVSG